MIERAKTFVLSIFEMKITQKIPDKRQIKVS